MKLISMTEFVIEKTNKITNEWSEDDQIRLLDEISNYANFLNQPLTLGMFVCEVPEPELQIHENGADYCDEWVSQYLQAKDKVLFEGFEYAKTHSIGMEKVLDLFVFPYTETKIGLTKKSEGFRTWFKLEKIEDLVQCNLTITPNAIKQLKL